MEYKVLALGDVASETACSCWKRSCGHSKRSMTCASPWSTGENISGSGLTKAQAEALSPPART